MQIYEKIKQLRLDHHLTQQEAADLLNISQYRYAKYELGSHIVDDETKIRITELYRITMDDLYGLTNFPRVYQKGFMLRLFLPDPLSESNLNNLRAYLELLYATQ